jgi:hypothetical protein
MELLLEVNRERWVRLEVRRRLLHQLHGERARRRAGGPLSRRQRAGSCVHHTASRESLGFGAAVAYGGCEDAGLVGAGVESGTAIADRPLHRVAAKGQGHRAAHQHRQARNWVADAARSSWCPPIQLLISLGIHHRPLKLYHSPWSARGYLRLDVFRGEEGTTTHTCNFIGAHSSLLTVNGLLCLSKDESASNVSPVCHDTDPSPRGEYTADTVPLLHGTVSFLPLKLAKRWHAEPRACWKPGRARTRLVERGRHWPLPY